MRKGGHCWKRTCGRRVPKRSRSSGPLPRPWMQEKTATWCSTRPRPDTRSSCWMPHWRTIGSYRGRRRRCLVAVRELLPRLRDPQFTRVLIVTLPEATPVHEAAKLQQDLVRAGIRLLPGSSIRASRR